jgi:hypothetical protein
MFRKITTGVALSAALLLPLAACSSSSDKGGDAGSKAAASPSPSPSAKPAETLAAAVTKTKGVNVRYKLGDATDNMAGAFDVAKKAGSMDGASDGEKMQLVVTENDLYISGLSDLQGNTVHMLIAKIPADHDMTVMTDPLAALAMLTGAVTVTSPSADLFQGTLDLNKATAATPGAKKVIESVIKAGGAKASAVPFNAKVDAQGYLSEFGATLPGIDAGKDVLYNLTLSDFASAVTVTVPTSKVVEAPDAAYQQ